MSIELDELKIVVEDRRFYVTRYFQAAAFYLAILALGVKSIIETQSPKILLVLAVVFELFNFLAFFLAYQFKRIVYDSLNREIYLSSLLKFKPPTDLNWGYWSGIYISSVALIGLPFIACVKYSALVAVHEVNCFYPICCFLVLPDLLNGVCC